MNDDLTDMDKVQIYAFIDSYFDRMRMYCQRNITMRQEQQVRDSSIYMLLNFLSDTEYLPLENRVQYMTRIQNQFVRTLQDYDRRWLWDIFNEFSKNLPETMLN